MIIIERMKKKLYQCATPGEHSEGEQSKRQHYHTILGVRVYGFYTDVTFMIFRNREHVFL